MLSWGDSWWDDWLKVRGLYILEVAGGGVTGNEGRGALVGGGRTEARGSVFAPESD